MSSQHIVYNEAVKLVRKYIFYVTQKCPSQSEDSMDVIHKTIMGCKYVLTIMSVNYKRATYEKEFCGGKMKCVRPTRKLNETWKIFAQLR